jgi:hypothetical protein
MDSPRMLYRCPGPEKFEGVACETTIVEEAEAEAHKAAGWFTTWIEAGEAHVKAAEEAVKREAEELDDKAAATRDEIEQKLTELGVIFDRRLGTKKLSALLEAALAAARGAATPQA